MIERKQKVVSIPLDLQAQINKATYAKKRYYNKAPQEVIKELLKRAIELEDKIPPDPELLQMEERLSPKNLKPMTILQHKRGSARLTPPSKDDIKRLVTKLKNDFAKILTLRFLVTGQWLHMQGWEEKTLAYQASFYWNGTAWEQKLCVSGNPSGRPKNLPTLSENQPEP